MPIFRRPSEQQSIPPAAIPAPPAVAPLPAAQPALPPVVRADPLLLPIGHCVGAQHRLGQATAPRQIRRGAEFHDVSEDLFAVWVAAHGAPEAVANGQPWHRRSVERHPRVATFGRAEDLIDQLLRLRLLVEVMPDTNQALDFARSHRLVPLMLGLGNTGDDPDSFGIGFLHQPVLEVSFGIYDLWQWSTMDDSLLGTCENAADVARRAGSADPDSTDPATMLAGFLPSLHALLLTNAAYLDTPFRLRWPQRAMASPTGGSISAALRAG